MQWLLKNQIYKFFPLYCMSMKFCPFYNEACYIKMDKTSWTLNNKYNNYQRQNKLLVRTPADVLHVQEVLTHFFTDLQYKLVKTSRTNSRKVQTYSYLLNYITFSAKRNCTAIYLTIINCSTHWNIN